MKAPKTNIIFSLKSVKIENFWTFESNLVSGKEKVDFFTSIQVKMYGKTKQLAIFIELESTQNTRIIMKLLVSCHFKIKPAAWNKLISVDKKTITFSKGLLTHLAVLTVGTARGVLAAKTEKTVFEKYCLPTVNVSRVFTEDLLFDL